MSFDLEQNQIALENLERSEIELQLKAWIGKLLLFEGCPTEISEENWSIDNCLKDFGNNRCSGDDFHAEEMANLQEIIWAHFLEIKSVWLIERLVIFKEDLLVGIRMEEVINTHVAFLD